MNSIPKHLNFFSDADRARFVQLVKQSVWLSRHEKKLFLEGGDKDVPQYLVELALKAVEEEAEFFAKMKTENPEQFDYLENLRTWLSNPEKRLRDFPGLLDDKGQLITIEEIISPKQPKNTDKNKVNS